MYKIENYLFINAKQVSIGNVVKQFLKESSLLVSNLHKSFIVDKTNKTTFPIIGEEYDASWYKNLLIAGNIIVDRLNGHIIEQKQYADLIRYAEKSSFTAFAKTWNIINLLTSFNTPNSEWISICKQYNLHLCAQRIQALIDANISISQDFLNQISLNLNGYVEVQSLPLLTTTQTVETNNESSGNKEATTETIVKNDSTVTTDIAEANDKASDDIIPFDNLSIYNANKAINANTKELNLVCNWLKENEKIIARYKQIANMSKDPHELKHINELIAKLEEELKTNTEVLETIKAKLPASEHAKEFEQLNQWVKSIDSSVDATSTSDTTSATVDTIPVVSPIKPIDTAPSLEKDIKISVEKQISSIEKEIENTNNEIFLIDKTTQLIKEYKPNHPALKMYVDLLAWIENKENIINTKA